MDWFFCYLLEESWPDVLHIFGESIPKVLTLINYNERYTIVHRRIFILEHVMEIFIQNTLCCLPKTILYLASSISRDTSSFVDKTMERILRSFISSICFNIRTICTSFTITYGARVKVLGTRLFRVDISDFLQSWSAKFPQLLSTKEDES